MYIRYPTRLKDALDDDNQQTSKPHVCTRLPAVSFVTSSAKKRTPEEVERQWRHFDHIHWILLASENGLLSEMESEIWPTARVELRIVSVSHY